MFRYPANYKQSQNPRKVVERRARPAWVNLAKMREFYYAAELARGLGIDVQADHEVPLRGRLVSGLDCEFNLQLMFAEDNSRKCNHFGVD
jgi:hypothetical protein